MVPTAATDHAFRFRRVRCPRDVFRWERSEAMADVVAFVDRMNAVAMRGPPASAADHCGGRVNVAATVLRRVAGWAARHAPAADDDSGGGGGGAPEARRRFREFHGRLRADGRDLLTSAYGAAAPGHRSTVELAAYLDRSFGDADAAAYGPQHELSFCMFLIALFKLHRLECADEPHVVPVLFDRYTDVVDELVRRYRLEPSDEYGDAGLNDYRYVGFLWGSAQLAAADGPSARSPAAVIADDRGGAGLFAKCVAAAYRRAAERARALGRPRPEPAWRHSYQLWNLSACARWSRVNRCLMAAFRGQVLGGFRVVRHLAFGELLRFAPDPRPPVASFYDCVPAAAAAVAATEVELKVNGDYGEGIEGSEGSGDDGDRGQDDGEDCGEDGRRDSERRPSGRHGSERPVENFWFE